MTTDKSTKRPVTARRAATLTTTNPPAAQHQEHEEAVFRMTDIEMASLASGDAKNQLTTRLAAAETHVKAVTKLKSKLPANERQLAERLLASAEPLIGSRGMISRRASIAT